VGTKTVAVISGMALAAAIHAQTVDPQTAREFDCYVQSAEARMDAAKAFLLADSDTSLNEQLVHGGKIQTVAPQKPNPRKVTGGLIFDWIGLVFIPGAALDRTLRMLRDYDHRAQYFPEILSASKLLCRTGEDHFGFSMRLKEPAVIDAESDVVWERIDPHRWRCRSYSTGIREIGKNHGYLLRLYSYWRFAEIEKGVYVQGETITLSGEFGSLTRALGSMVGISPEKSLKRTLASMRESALNPALQVAGPQAGIPQCGPPYRPAGCSAKTKGGAP
jgi:hypothetical protein